MNDQPSKQQIRQMLIQLHDQLAKSEAEGLGENEQALMQHLMVDIQEMLERAEHGTSPRYQANPTVLERMEIAMAEMEVTHPILTGMIKKALDTLNIAGI